MCSKEVVEKIDNGKAIVVSRGAIQWTAIIAITIFILTQAVLFGIWKGGTDEKIEAQIKTSDDRFTRLEKGGSIIALESQHRLDVVIHNLKRLMEKQGLRWEELK